MAIFKACYKCEERWTDGKTTCHATCKKHQAEIALNNKVNKLRKIDRMKQDYEVQHHVKRKH